MHLEFICVKLPWHYTAEASTGRSSSDSEESDSKHIPTKTITRLMTFPMQPPNKPIKNPEILARHQNRSRHT